MVVDGIEEPNNILEVIYRVQDGHAFDIILKEKVSD
jgi:hypothetical protein